MQSEGSLEIIIYLASGLNEKFATDFQTYPGLGYSHDGVNIALVADSPCHNRCVD